MAAETERERALYGFGEFDAPEAAVGLGLYETAFVAEAMKVNRTALAAFAPNLVFDTEVLFDVPGVKIRRDRCPAALTTKERA